MIALNLSGPMAEFGRDLVRLREAGIPFLMQRTGGAWLGSRTIVAQYGDMFRRSARQNETGTATVYVRPRDKELVPYVIFTKSVEAHRLGLRFVLIAPDN